MSAEELLGGRVVLHGGDCLDVLAMLEADSIDSVVTDPPYHFASIVKRFGGENASPTKAHGAYKRATKGFMGQTWDGGQIAHEPKTWAAVFRVMKPGAHLVAFHAPKNWHRQATAIEDAGFLIDDAVNEVRDVILYLFSRDDVAARFLASLTPEQAEAFATVISHAGDGGALAWLFGTGFPKSHNLRGEFDGFGSALKPSFEPIVLARKPFAGSVAGNMVRHGVGALNIDAARIACSGGSPMAERRKGSAAWLRRMTAAASNAVGKIHNRTTPETFARARAGEALGRWPADVCTDGSDEVDGAFPDAPGQMGHVRGGAEKPNAIYGDFSRRTEFKIRGDSGSASRFFYSAKANNEERAGSNHPTVKPQDLMRWLCRLVTPPGGRILDPFAGTGSTGQAAYIEGFDAVLIEKDETYRADIRRRMELIEAGPAERLAATIDAADDPGPLFNLGAA